MHAPPTELAWFSWVTAATRHESVRQIARRCGVSPTAVAGWMVTQPPMGAVVRISIAYDAPLLMGLVAAGYVSREDAKRLASPELFD